MSMYSAKTLRELSAAMRTMTEQSTASAHMSAAAKAAKCLQSELREDAALLQVMHVAVIASLLSDLVSQIKKITESVGNLAKLARFKKPEKKLRRRWLSTYRAELMNRQSSVRFRFVVFYTTGHNHIESIY
jgi:hypothetical protein